MTELTLAVLVLMLGACLCLLPMPNRRRAAIGLASQAIATALGLWVAMPVLLGGPEISGSIAWAYPVGTLLFRLDALGAFFLSWSLPMTGLGSLYALGYLARHMDGPRHVGVHFALLNMTSLSFLLIYTGQHTITFLFGWEIAALAAWLLVIWDYTSQKIRFAGFNYLVSTHIGLIFLVAAVMVLYARTESWFLGDFGLWLQQHPGTTRNAVFLLLVTSFALKSAFFPFHSWLPRAHAAAPAHVSALMSGVIHKAGLYALARFVLLIGKPDEWMGWFLIAFSSASVLIGGIYTVRQSDLKRLLGYSSTENVGIAGIGFGIGCLGLSWQRSELVLLGFGGGLLHILNHAFFKCQLFYAAGCINQIKQSVNLERLGGLAVGMPVTALCFLVGALAISGLPPFNGFTSEFLIYAGLLQPGAGPALLAMGLAAALLAFIGALSALSMTRAFGTAFLGHVRDPQLPPAREASRWMLLPLMLHALGTLTLGIAPVLGFRMIHAPAQLFLAGQPPGCCVAAEGALQGALENLTTIAALTLLVLALAWCAWRLSGGHRVRRTATWGCGYLAPHARMQYSASSFSQDFARHFSGLMVLRHREQLPQGFFPTRAHAETQCVDAVERRLYSLIDHGDESAARLSQRLREDDPRPAFAALILALLAIAGIVLGLQSGLT